MQGLGFREQVDKVYGWGSHSDHSFLKFPEYDAMVIPGTLLVILRLLLFTAKIYLWGLGYRV